MLFLCKHPPLSVPFSSVRVQSTIERGADPCTLSIDVTFRAVAQASVCCMYVYTLRFLAPGSTLFFDFYFSVYLHCHQSAHRSIHLPKCVREHTTGDNVSLTLVWICSAPPVTSSVVVKLVLSPLSSFFSVSFCEK